MSLVHTDPVKGESLLIPRSVARKRLGASHSTWWRWQGRARMKMPVPIKIGGRFFYRLDEFEAWEKQVITRGLELKPAEKKARKNSRPVGRPRKKALEHA